MTRRAAAVLLVLFLLGAGPAAARDVVHVRGLAEVQSPFGELATFAALGTALAGPRAVISSVDENAVPHMFLMRRDGSLRPMPRYDGPLAMPALTFIPRGPNSGDLGGQTAGVAASSSLVLTTNVYSFARGTSAGYRVGGFHGRPSQWRRCYGLQRAFSVAVSGSAYAHLQCHGPDLGVVVRDRRRPGLRRRLFAPPHYDPSSQSPAVQMAGRYLALRSTARHTYRGLLQVFDWRKGREVYRVRLPKGGFSFDIQSDGKVAVVKPAIDSDAPVTCDLQAPVAWYSPSEPRAHVLPSRVCGPDVAIARDRIVYRGPGSFGSVLWMTNVHGGPPVRVSGSPWMIDFIVDLLPPFDFDGRRIVYGEPGCADERVVRDDVRAIARRGYLRAAICPIRFAGPSPIVERPDGRIAVTVECPQGCRGGWWVADAEHPDRLLVSGGDLQLPRGQVRTLVSDESALPRRLAGRTPQRRRVRVVLTADQPIGTTKTTVMETTIRTTRGAAERKRAVPRHRLRMPPGRLP